MKAIDRHDATAIWRKAECGADALADAAIAGAVPACVGVSEDEARAALEKVMRTLVDEIDELERQVLRDLDALSINVQRSE